MRTATTVTGGRSAVKLVEQREEPRPPVRQKLGRAAGEARNAGPRNAEARNAPAAAQAARGVKVGGAKSGTKPAVVPASNRRGKSAKSRKSAATARGGRGRLAAEPRPIRVVKIKELNAQGKCGPGTSVVHLFRVDEVCDGSAAVHLVFFDRHGWYCEHGRSCPAVDDVRKLAGSHLTRPI